MSERDEASDEGSEVTSRHGGIVLSFRSIATEDDGRRIEEGLRGVAGIMSASANPAVQVARVEEEVPIASVQPGDHVVVKPGERLAVDGAVVEGYSAVNQASITGESA